MTVSNLESLAQKIAAIDPCLVGRLRYSPEASRIQKIWLDFCYMIRVLWYRCFHDLDSLLEKYQIEESNQATFLNNIKDFIENPEGEGKKQEVQRLRRVLFSLFPKHSIQKMEWAVPSLDNPVAWKISFENCVMTKLNDTRGISPYCNEKSNKIAPVLCSMQKQGEDSWLLSFDKATVVCEDTERRGCTFVQKVGFSVVENKLDLYLDLGPLKDVESHSFKDREIIVLQEQTVL